MIGRLVEHDWFDSDLVTVVGGDVMRVLHRIQECCDEVRGNDNQVDSQD
jgi:hypothetical protein